MVAQRREEAEQKSREAASINEMIEKERLR